MNLMLAQLESVPAEALKNWMLIFAGLVAAIYYAKEILGGKKKREVSFEAELTRQEVFERHEADNALDFDGLRNEIKQERETNQEHARERQKNLFAEIKETRTALERRINRISVGVARVCGKLNIHMPDEDAEI